MEAAVEREKERAKAAGEWDLTAEKVEEAMAVIDSGIRQGSRGTRKKNKAVN